MQRFQIAAQQRHNNNPPSLQATVIKASPEQPTRDDFVSLIPAGSLLTLQMTAKIRFAPHFHL
jgi:hypothetical protein